MDGRWYFYYINPNIYHTYVNASVEYANKGGYNYSNYKSYAGRVSKMYYITEHLIARIIINDQ